MFPRQLDSPLAGDIAKAMGDGFYRHYRLFRTESARAKHRFETADWQGQQRAQTTLRSNFQLQAHSSLFFRNKPAYAVGKVINGDRETPFFGKNAKTASRRAMCMLCLRTRRRSVLPTNSFQISRKRYE